MVAVGADLAVGWKEAYIGIGREYMKRFTSKPFFRARTGLSPTRFRNQRNEDA